MWLSLHGGDAQDFDQDFGLARILQGLAKSAPTIGDALIFIIRYMHLYRRNFNYRLESRSGQAFLYLDGYFPCSPKAIERLLLDTVSLISELRGEKIRPRVIGFSHSSTLDRSQCISVFGCCVRFNQAQDYLVFSADLLGLACSRRDPALHAMVRSFMEANCATNEKYCIRVERKVITLLPTLYCDIENVSRDLGMHSRTLQRRLSKEGADFEGILDKVRRRQADQMLRKTTLSISQIATELGYRSVSSFSRAHKRWLKISPQEYRRMCWLDGVGFRG